MKKIIALVAVVALVFGAVGAQAGDAKEAQQAIAGAKAAQKKADSIQGGWVTTDKLIKKAEQAAANGDHTRALSLAKKAKLEAESAFAQADYELKNWSPPAYIPQK